MYSYPGHTQGGGELGGDKTWTHVHRTHPLSAIYLGKFAVPKFSGIKQYRASTGV